MAFRLRTDDSAADGLHRLVKGQFRASLESLGERRPGGSAVHEARKRVKRIRAIVRLLREELDSGGARDEKHLRAAAHALSDLRDADATVETLDALHGRYRAVVTAGVTRAVARGLRARKRRVRKGAGVLAQRAQGQLRRSRSSVPRRVRRAATPKTVHKGLIAGYRRARRQLRRISLDSDATQFHAWRRRVKDHSYHVKLFRGLHATPRGRARSLECLETLLGEDHNHAILRATILAAPERFGGAVPTTAVMGSIVKRQDHLRRQALRLGQSLFWAKPRDFGKKASAWWRGKVPA